MGEIITCEIHGEYEKRTLELLGREIVLKCPHCAKVEADQDLAKEQKKKEARESERVARWAEIARIPKRYRDFDFKPLENQSKAVLDWDYRKNIVIIGGVGAGKTGYACWLAMKAIREGKSAKYTTMSEITANIRDSWTSKTASEGKIINDLIEVDVLIIDEIGRGEYQDYHFRVIDNRYNEMKPTILMGNVKFEEMENTLGTAITSRLRGGGVLAFSFGNEDNR